MIGRYEENVVEFQKALAPLQDTSVNMTTKQVCRRYELIRLMKEVTKVDYEMDLKKN